MLDDLQWADPLSVQVVERLAERSEGTGLVLALFREEPDEPRPAAERLLRALCERSDAFHVRLASLGDEDVARFVESMLGRAPSPQVASLLRRATEGLPHDVEQVVRELAVRGVVQADDDGSPLSLSSAVDLGGLTASEATRSHLAALGPVARRIVLTLLLAGGGLTVTTIAAALSLEEDALLDELDVLVRENVLRDGPGADVVSLTHERIGEAIASGTSADDIGALRKSLARALETSASGAEDSHRVAALDLAAANLEDSLRSVPRSAEAYAAAGLHALAVERYDALIDLAARAGAPAPTIPRKRRADLMAQSGRTEEAIAEFSALAEDPVAQEALPPWQARQMQGFYLMLLTRHDEALAVLQRALAAAQAVGDASAAARCLSIIGTVEDRLGRIDACRERHEEAVRVARKGGTSLDVAMALNNLGVSAYREGRLDEATSAYREAAPLFEEAGDRLHAANCRAGLAAVLLARGEPETCRPIAREALSSMREWADVRGLSRVLELLGLSSLALGEVDEAEACLGEALAIRGRLDEPWAAGEARLNLALLATWTCDWTRATRLLDEAAELFSRAGDASRLALIAARRADLAWRSEDPRARTLAGEALAAAARPDAEPARLEAGLTLVRLDADSGDESRACARARDLLDGVRDREPSEILVAVESELLASRARSGDLEGLRADAERVAARAARRRATARPAEWMAAALAFGALGDTARHADHAGEGERVLVRLRDRLPDAHRETFLRQHAHARWTRRADETQEETMSAAEREDLDRFRTFHSLVMASEPAEPDVLLATFLTSALDQLDFARGLVFVSERGELTCRAARDSSGRDIPVSSRRVPDQLLRHALERGEPVLMVGVKGDASVAWEGSVAELGVEAFAAVPVATGGGRDVVAYFDGPPPRRDVRDALRRLSPVFGDLGTLLERARRAKERTERVEAILSSMSGNDGLIVGSAPSVEELRRLIRTVAPTDASVLVLGENGTGKELVARELHSRSLRKDGPMLSRSCAELTETLLESELFGHEKGAFTGAARDRGGLFEAASGGTLFLDEVGEMSQGLQAKLLRVLETGEVTRLGSTRSRKVDVRVLAATHRDLAAGVRAGTFRQDLYYRLKVIELRVPALRDRRADVALLAHHFLALQAASRARAPRAFTHDALRALARHDWPGNVRELRNVVERAVILSGERDEIGLDLLPPEVLGTDDVAMMPTAGSPVSGKDLRAAREAFERACIERALEECAGNRTHAARALQISLRSLQQKMGRHGVS